MTEDQRTQLPPQYAPGEVEARRYDEWVAKGLFTPDALEAVADQAILRGTGARGLRAILEEVLLSEMYEVPSRKDVERVVITGPVVLENVNPTLVPRGVTSRRTPREKSA